MLDYAVPLVIIFLFLIVKSLTVVVIEYSADHLKNFGFNQTLL